MKSAYITIGILLVILLIAGYFAWQSQQHWGGDARDSDAARSLSAGDDDADMEGEKSARYTDLDGNPVDLKQYAGQVRVVNSWATWSPFSLNELPALGALAAEMPDGEGVVIAINRSETNTKAAAYVGRLSGVDEIIFVQDANDYFYSSVEGFAMPETIFYRADGSVAVHKRGHMSLEEMRQHYETATQPVVE